jgi:hypothetical protein
MNTFRSQCPIVERTEETFVEYVSVAGERRRMEFTKTILWIQQSESVVQFVHGGKVLDETQRTNDYYGYLTSCEPSSPSPSDIAKAYSVTADSTLEIIVKTTVSKRPGAENQDTIAKNKANPTYVPTYVDVPTSWRKEVVIDGETSWPTLESAELGEGVVWSSKNTPEKNAALLAAFRATWAVPAPADVAVAA